MDLLTATEVCRLLGLPRSTFYHYQTRGYFRFAEAAKPLGTRRYVKTKIENWNAGESGVQFGRKKSA